jgi:oxepin-CoA hydrolase / 3-oxo-5,6-dehydrosuberyl-CoA semialdehyde dehydrogenase
MQLQSYAYGQWLTGRDRGVGMHDATSGEIVGNASSTGLDFAAMLSHARNVGGPALRAMTFHERAALLKSLAKRLA